MPDDPVLEEFRAKFRIDQLTLAANSCWALSLRPGQLTLGAMVLSAVSGEQRFAALGTKQGEELTEMLGVAERLALETYGAVRINVVALMMKDSIVHFHILPRYDRSIDRHGVTWSDHDWPGPPSFGPAQTDDAVLLQIRDELRAAV